MATTPEPQNSRPPAIQIYGKVGCPLAYSIRDFLHRNDAPFEWHELRTDEQCRVIGISGPGDAKAPVVILPDGTRLEHPTIRQITEKLGWFHNPARSEYDLAIYGASEGLRTVVIERWALGGQAGSSPKIENYLG